MNVITIGNWKGVLGRGLAPRELEATLYAAADLTAKETARFMDVSHRTVSKRLDDARFKVGARTVRGLVVEALSRGLIFLASTASPSPAPQRQQEQESTLSIFVA